MFFRNPKSTALTIFLIAASFLLIFTAPASAQIVGLTNRPISQIIASVIDWLLSIAAGLTILFIVIGGIYYVTAAGDEHRMTTAKMIITYSIMGLLFIAISYSIVVTVNSIINP